MGGIAIWILSNYRLVLAVLALGFASAYSYRLGDEHATRRCEKETARLREAAQASADRHSAEYELDSRRYQLEAHIRDLELSTFALPDGTSVRGLIRADATGRGTIDNPSGDLKLLADRVMIADHEVGRLEAGARVENQRAVIEVSAPRFNLTGNADTSLADLAPVQTQDQALIRHDVAVAGGTDATHQDARPGMNDNRLHRADTPHVADVELVAHRCQLVEHVLRQRRRDLKSAFSRMRVVRALERRADDGFLFERLLHVHRRQQAPFKAVRCRSFIRRGQD